MMHGLRDRNTIELKGNVVGGGPVFENMFTKFVQPINDEPLELDRRLDFAGAVTWDTVSFDVQVGVVDCRWSPKATARFRK